jgi:hypothetical protein
MGSIGAPLQQQDHSKDDITQTLVSGPPSSLNVTFSNSEGQNMVCYWLALA